MSSGFRISVGDYPAVAEARRRSSSTTSDGHTEPDFHRRSKPKNPGRPFPIDIRIRSPGLHPLARRLLVTCASAFKGSTAQLRTLHQSPDAPAGRRCTSTRSPPSPTTASPSAKVLWRADTRDWILIDPDLSAYPWAKPRSRAPRSEEIVLMPRPSGSILFNSTNHLQPTLR